MFLCNRNAFGRDDTDEAAWSVMCRVSQDIQQAHTNSRFFFFSLKLWVAVLLICSVWSRRCVAWYWNIVYMCVCCWMVRWFCLIFFLFGLIHTISFVVWLSCEARACSVQTYSAAYVMCISIVYHTACCG